MNNPDDVNDPDARALRHEMTEIAARLLQIAGDDLFERSARRVIREVAHNVLDVAIEMDEFHNAEPADHDQPDTTEEARGER